MQYQIKTCFLCTEGWKHVVNNAKGGWDAKREGAT